MLDSVLEVQHHSNCNAHDLQPDMHQHYLALFLPSTSSLLRQMAPMVIGVVLSTSTHTAQPAPAVIVHAVHDRSLDVTTPHDSCHASLSMKVAFHALI